MSDWIIIDVVEDLEAGDGPRLLIVYSTPHEYAPDGVYSYSMPKDHFNQFAAAFDYDLDDEDERQELFDHVVHHGFMKAVMYKRGDASSLLINPYRVGKSEAKQAVRRHLEAFRKSGFPRSAKPALGDQGAAEEGTDWLSHLRAHMDQILDHDRISVVDKILDPSVDSREVADVLMKRRRIE